MKHEDSYMCVRQHLDDFILVCLADFRLDLADFSHFCTSKIWMIYFSLFGGFLVGTDLADFSHFCASKIWMIYLSLFGGFLVGTDLADFSHFLLAP
jgi:hypothetical protein